MSLLEVTGLNTYYGDSHILFDVALRVERNEVVALLGRNGAGKSTTLKSLMGVVAPRNGSIMFDGADIAGKKSHAVARAGMQLVHEDRRIFGSLNVEENLVLAGLTAGSRWPLERIRASRSGGEAAARRSQVANSRCLPSRARSFAIPRSSCSTSRSKGWRRVIVHDLVKACRALTDAGQTIILVEQNLAAALTLAQRAYIINNGHIAHEGPTSEIRARPQVLQRYLGV